MNISPSNISRWVKERISLYKSGAGLLEIQRQLRHHDLRTVQIYLESMGIMECENIKRFPSL